MTSTNRRHTLTLVSFCAGLLALAPGCPASHGGDPDGGAVLDAPASAPDAPAPLVDAPAPALDAPGVDAPAPTADVTLRDTGPRPDTATPCAGLAPADCLGAWCVPVFDDACCRTCAPGGPCADCTNLEYHGCEPLEASPCRSGSVCGDAPTWACGPAAPFCDAASVVDLDSCDVTGCVPAYPSAMGEPDLAMARCVPIVAASCTVACRRLSPPCPTGMTPEGDGFCYTDRCIPSFVCGR